MSGNNNGGNGNESEMKSNSTSHSNPNQGPGYPSTLGVANKSIIDEENSMNFDPAQEQYRQQSIPLKSAHADYSVVPSATRSTSINEQSIISEGTNGQHHTAHQESNQSIISSVQIPDIHHSRGECYEFTHGFLRDAIYEQMLFTQRIRIHNSAQKYLRKVLQAISYLPEYPSKALDTRDYDNLLKRHEAIARTYQNQQKNIGPMISEDSKKPSRRHTRLPNFVGLN